MSTALRALYGADVRVDMSDGTTITGKLASVDDRFNLAIKGARDSGLAGTPFECAAADKVRLVRGESVVGVYSTSS